MAEVTPLIAFALDDQRVALSLSSVERIVRLVEITPLPQAPAIVLGVVNLQGRIIPVLDVRRRFGWAGREPDVTNQLIIARTARRSVALLVDRVLDILHPSAGSVLEGDAILPRLDYMKGVVKLPDGLVLIHDLDTFLSLEEEAAVDRALQECSAAAHG